MATPQACEFRECDFHAPSIDRGMYHVNAFAVLVFLLKAATQYSQGISVSRLYYKASHSNACMMDTER